MGQKGSNNNSDNNYEEKKSFFMKEEKAIKLNSLIILSALIFAVILILLKLYLFAGIMIIVAAALGIIVIKSAVKILKVLSEKFKEAAESSGIKDDVITDFSHRIREPLNNLVVIGELLIKSELQKKQMELIETLIASTQNMVDTVNELTMQSAVSVSYKERKKIRFNISSTIQNTIDLFRLKNPHIDFILNKKDFSHFEVIGEPIVLKQILLDLFNVIEEQNTDLTTKVTITLKKERETENETFVNVRIQTDRNIELIDEKKVPGDHAAQLISDSNGYFNRESGQNYSVLTFTLPFTNITPEEKKLIVSPRIEALKLKEKPRKELKDANILLVEDNPINQKITLLTLKPLVNNIDTAIDGREALEKFGNTTYDLILMDIQMPIMTGLIAAEKIRALEISTNTHVPIIAITANAMLGDKERCLSAGMDDYISKPFQPSALIEIIKKHI